MQQQQQRQMMARQRQLSTSQISPQDMLRLQHHNQKNYGNVPVLNNPPAPKRKQTMSNESLPDVFQNEYPMANQQQQQRSTAMKQQLMTPSHSVDLETDFSKNEEYEKLFSMGNYMDPTVGLQNLDIDSIKGSLDAKEPLGINMGLPTKMEITSSQDSMTPTDSQSSITNPQAFGEMIQEVAAPTGHSNKIFSCCMDPFGSVLASAGQDKKIYIWEINGLSDSTQPVMILDKHTGRITCTRFLDATVVVGNVNCLDSVPMLLASCGNDKTVRITKITGLKNQGTPLFEEINCFTLPHIVAGVDFCPMAFNLGTEREMVYIVASLDCEGTLTMWNVWTRQQYLSIQLVSIFTRIIFNSLLLENPLES
jgi:WD40 repeat protein